MILDPCPLFLRSWRAANYSHFWGMTLENGIRHRLGTFRPSPTVMNMNEIHVSPPPGGGGKLRHAKGCPWPSQRFPIAGKGLPGGEAGKETAVFGDSSSANSPGQSPGCQCCFFPLSSELVSHRNGGPAAADSAEPPAPALLPLPVPKPGVGVQTRGGHPNQGVPGGLAELGARPAPRSRA